MEVHGRRPGDVRVRRERIRPLEYTVPPPPKARRARPTSVVLIYGFAALIGIGTVLLMLPISSATGQWTPLHDALFTATSAVCVTGLVVVDTGTYWSTFGQLIIVTLIQAGGFGFMTGSTLLLLLFVRGRTRLRDRIRVQESMGGGELADVAGLVRRVAVFTFLAEAVGALLLAPVFASHGLEGIKAVWFGAFHAISAFNNAGFDLMGSQGSSSLTAFAGSYAVLGIIGALIVLGGLGYAIVDDVVHKRRWRRFALETKVVLATTAALLAIGTLLIGSLEWSNPVTLGSLPIDQRVLNAAFWSVTARTAGFNSLDTAALLPAAVVVVMGLMFIGGASGSTAGGIKANTFSVLLIAIVSMARGLPSADAFGRRIEHIVVYRALTVAFLSLGVVFVASTALQALSGADALDVVFEAVSAFATVGLSRGLTPGLSDTAQLVLIGAMFVGRLGPLTVALALAARSHRRAYRPAVESIRLG